MNEFPHKYRTLGLLAEKKSMPLEAFLGSRSDVEYVMIETEFEVVKHYITRLKTGSQLDNCDT